ncbi:hypothetical protein ACHQM5_024787 [Ranunculus cassubicifolius]
MSPKILSWNLRGVGGKEKKSWARKMRMKWRASMFLIQESKVEVVSEKLARQLWGGRVGVVSNVYGPRLEGERWEMWKELEDVRGVWGGPWRIGGDLMR